MAPVPPTKHSRHVRSAKDPRGIYAPTSATDNARSPADLHTSPHKRKRSDGDDGDAEFGFKINKKDKRSIRHQVLLNKVRHSGISKDRKVLKRRRPAKKLKTDIGGLADALPDDVEPSLEFAGLRKATKRKAPLAERAGTMKMRSLKNRPGAMKRKRKMEGLEVERFRRNMAMMVGKEGERAASLVEKGGGAQHDGSGGYGADRPATSDQADRWAALRRFIGATMETSDMFPKR
ncbi:hypothetical protein BAUCODRAFT_118108 [Baudoinia panamericana UAMH 10762]|uniref:Ribosome biogenesis protein SLX9 n=1 Tax=Baudoinia panamericana (strain UAMH 10762) TaxID=717646 RepID=M2MHW7_BAUPA|nr:uncharacterized protein BAUCODRAFT_118108 [Baudoinia panamericana UAMH 10762]EMC90853.1 hypothetical protein BAUCODRAFT_118108 [Baudoinia panamericana UAMH 10762]